MPVYFLFILCFANAPGTSPNPWAQMTLTDLEACYELIRLNHPGPVDTHNPAFKAWMEEGYHKAKAMAQTVDSADGLIYTLRYYASGFHDGHLTYRNFFTRQQLQWPGFVVAQRGGRYVVHHVMEGAGEGLPAVGDELLACDGRPPAEVMTRDVMPYYYGRPTLESSWVKNAPFLLLQDGNPFRKQVTRCTFKGTAGEKNLVLSWRATTREKLETPLEKAAFGKRGNYAIRHIDPDRVWLSIPSNGPRTPEQISALKEIVDAMPGLRQKKLVVIDVRGNSGGNSRWGNLIVEGLYGEAYLRYLQNLEVNPGTFVDWRVSQENAAHLGEICKLVAERFGEDSSSYRHFAAVGQGLKAALAKGEALFHLPQETIVPQTLPLEEPAYKGQTVFLTDGRCGSACLDFADTILAVPGVVFAGFPTSADTVYMEVRSEILPSKMGRLGFAVKVYRNRNRGNNQPHIPPHRFEGDLWDTPALETWLLELTR